MRTTPANTRERSKGPLPPSFWAMLAIHLGALLAFLPQARPDLGTLVLAGATFSIRTFAISAGYHRYFSHRSFRVGRVVQFVLAFVGGMGAMRSALWWASQHVQHHRASDRRGDPHTPRQGAFWSHMGWFMAPENQGIRWEHVEELRRYPELVWLDKHEWVPLLTINVVCYLIGGFPGWVWGSNVSTLVLCHATFALNSITHRFGARKYETADNSTNSLPIALVTFGEGWHNNHHHRPWRARLGDGPAEVDISWWCLVALERIGLVKDLKR